MIIIVALLLVAAVVLPRFLGNKEGLYTEERVKTAEIETYYTFSGNVESKNSQNIMAQKTMQISEIKVKEGDKVEIDDVLFLTSQEEEIKSKIDGTISKIYIEEDESVMAGTNLSDIIDFDNLQITIKVDEYDLSSIGVGKDVSVTINALDKIVNGKISEISNTAINKNGVAYFTAILDLDKSEEIKVGMSAEAKILNERVSNVLTLPMKVLHFNDEDEIYVLVEGEAGRPVEQMIRVGINDGKNVEIIQGLEDEQVVFYTKAEGTLNSPGGGGMFAPNRE